MSRFSTSDQRFLDDLVRRVARQHIMPWFRKLPPGGVRAKSSATDLVTIADEAAETAIAVALAERFPGALIVGEEAAATDPTLIGQLNAAGLAFVIDPIDGTANFAAGQPLFGVMLAVTERGKTTAAIIHDPLCDSSSCAQLGLGAYEIDSTGAQTPLAVAAAPETIATLRGMASWRFAEPQHRPKILANLQRVGASWDHRCAAHEYRALASGHSDFVLFNRLLPWDHLAGVLLHAEAGGAHTKFDGSSYQVGETSGGLICAANAVTCDMLRHELFR